MKKTTVDPALLQLLVSIYNQSIQTYFHFPEVIICGRNRLEREDFERLLHLRFIQPVNADSFGRWYGLSPQGEAYLLGAVPRKKQKPQDLSFPELQRRLPFLESCW